jgi:hypothetical protein
MNGGMVIAVWTLSAAAGTALSIWNARRRYRDIVRLRQAGVMNGRVTLVVAPFRMEVVRGLIQGAWLVLGVAALLGGPIEIAVPILLATSLATSLNTLLDARQIQVEDRVFGAVPDPTPE